jgi:hypothetical protein
MRVEGEAQRTNAGDRLVAWSRHACPCISAHDQSFTRIHNVALKNTLMFVRFFTLIRYVTKACLKLRPKL